MDQEIITVDRFDRLLMQALQLDGRVPFARLGQLLEVSEQTVARRYRRLLSAGVLRVIGMLDPAAMGQSSWNVRIKVRPGSAIELAEALARRPDTGWVTLTSGGSEIVCVIHSRTSLLRDELLLRRLPATVQVISLTALAVLHRFDEPAGWTPGPDRLTSDVREALLAHALGGGLQSANTRSEHPELPVAALELSDQDEAMFAELAEDARIPASRLAELTGWTPARVNRRLDELVRAGLLYFDTEVALEPLGYREHATIWLTVGPAHLRTVGEALAGMPEVAFAAATTGNTNMIISTVCTDNAHLFRFVTDGLGSLPGIQGMEISPYLRRFKQAGTLMAGERLAVGPTRGDEISRVAGRSRR